MTNKTFVLWYQREDLGSAWIQISITEKGIFRSRGGYFAFLTKKQQNITKNNQRKRLKQKIIDYLGGKCQRCGLISPYSEIYDCHHKNPKEKDINIGHIGRQIASKSFELLKPELDKCILLCSNCHRIIHSKED